MKIKEALSVLFDQAFSNLTLSNFVTTQRSVVQRAQDEDIVTHPLSKIKVTSESDDRCEATNC